MAQPVQIDWSWGQAYKTPSFGAPPTPPEEPLSGDSRRKDGLDLARDAPAQDIFAHGYTVNEFRTAVPSPATKAEMSDLSLQRASVPRPQLGHIQRKPSSAGRKRSCAEMSSDEDSSSPVSFLDDASASPTKMIRLENGEVMDADSTRAINGNGVLAEELAERLRSSSFPDGSLRPQLLESRKSARIEPEGIPEDRPDTVADGAMAVDDGPEHETFIRNRTRTLTDHDEARVALGVGWSSVPATPIMLAAARGWSRFIENSFALRNVRVVWRNEGLQVLLVSGVTAEQNAMGREIPGSPGYYLLDEALTQGRLVARSWEKCLDYLRSNPIQFEGDVITAANAGHPMADTHETLMGATPSVVEERPFGMEID